MYINLQVKVNDAVTAKRHPEMAREVAESFPWSDKWRRSIGALVDF